MFAIAINTKLQRNDANKQKSVRMVQISNPARTVLFLEQGLKGEKPKAMPQQPAYDGSPKGSAKSFVARYNGLGVITFVAGNAETVEGRIFLKTTGCSNGRCSRGTSSGANPPRKATTRTSKGASSETLECGGKRQRHTAFGLDRGWAVCAYYQVRITGEARLFHRLRESEEVLPGGDREVISG